MDPKTIAKYDSHADSFIADWMKRTPTMLRMLIQKYFTTSSKVIDIGSGSGRDVAWMIDHGFNAEGIDASQGLLAAAKAKYPDAKFRFDSLPDLRETSSTAYDHALCSAVLMHLPLGEVPAAVENIVRVVKPGGRIICSVRPSRSDSEREADERLFSEISLEDLANIFMTNGCHVLSAEITKAEGSDRVWRTLVLEKR
jgi:ubiquinone/menaquinone biosynthesis C-methylase UbiE